MSLISVISLSLRQSSLAREWDRAANVVVLRRQENCQPEPPIAQGLYPTRVMFRSEFPSCQALHRDLLSGFASQAIKSDSMTMNVDLLRRFCLSFPGAKENLRWEDELCFKVGGKIFANEPDSVPQQHLSKMCS